MLASDTTTEYSAPGDVKIGVQVIYAEKKTSGQEKRLLAQDPKSGLAHRDRVVADSRVGIDGVDDGREEFLSGDEAGGGRAAPLVGAVPAHDVD